MTDYTHTLTNPGAESGDTTGWTSIVGSNLAVRSASPTPNTGSYYFYSSNDAEYRYYQRVDLVTDGVPTATIDSGGIWFWVEWYQSSYADDDQGEIQLRFLNSSQVEISTSGYGLFAAPKLVWNQYIYAPILPANTRYVDVIMHGYRQAGTACDAYFDDITAKSTDTNTTEARLTQHVVEVLRGGDSSDVRLTQHVVEVLRGGDSSDVRLTQHVVEVLRSTDHTTFTDFADQTPDQAPTGITKVAGSGDGSLTTITEDGVVGGTVLEETGENWHNWTFYVLDEPASVADAHVLTKIKLDKKLDPSYNYYYAAVGIRVQSDFTDSILAQIGYYEDNDIWRLRLGYYDDNVWTTLGSEYDLTTNGLSVSEGSWFYLRLYVVGTSIKAMAWGKSDDEPTAWQIEVTDSTISAAGQIGWGWYSLGLSSLKHRIDFLNIVVDDITDPVVPGNEGTTQAMNFKSNVDVLAEDNTSNYPTVVKSSVDVLTQVDKEYAKIDSNVIVL